MQTNGSASQKHSGQDSPLTYREQLLSAQLSQEDLVHQDGSLYALDVAVASAYATWRNTTEMTMYELMRFLGY